MAADDRSAEPIRQAAPEPSADPRPASGLNSAHAASISSRVAVRPSLLPSLIETLSVCPSSTATRLQCALIRAASGINGVTFQAPQQLQRLGFHLFFFAPDVRHHVAQDVHRRHARIPRAARPPASWSQKSARCQTAPRSASAPSPARSPSSWDWSPCTRPTPCRQGCSSIRCRWSAFTSGITSGTLGAMRNALEFDTTAQPAAANRGSSSRAIVGIQRGKNDLRRALGIGRRNRHPGNALGQRRVQPPLGGLAVRLAAGAVAGRQPRNLEPRMVLKQLNEALADHSGRAQNADWIFGLHD